MKDQVNQMKLKLNSKLLNTQCCDE